jgi:hypothetical protein
MVGEDGEGTAPAGGVTSFAIPANGPRAKALLVDLATGFRFCKGEKAQRSNEEDMSDTTWARDDFL